MLQGTAVHSVPHSHVFTGAHSHSVSRTQVKPNAFRINYFADGTGRDTFVKNDNGGFYKPYSPVPADKVGTFGSKRSWCPPAPIIKSRGVYYHSDGSGRDSYVGINAGGLTNSRNFLEYRDAFKKSLRTVDRPTTGYVKLGQHATGMQRAPSVTLLAPSGPHRLPDLYQEMQMSFPQGFNDSQQRLGRYQKGLDRRLSVPKH